MVRFRPLQQYRFFIYAPSSTNTSEVAIIEQQEGLFDISITFDLLCLGVVLIFMYPLIQSTIDDSPYEPNTTEWLDYTPLDPGLD